MKEAGELLDGSSASSVKVEHQVDRQHVGDCGGEDGGPPTIRARVDGWTQ